MKNFQTPPSIDVEYLQGIHITNSILWLDAVRSTDLCFLSHATAEPIRPHHKILLTKTTATLVQRSKRQTKMLVSPYHRRFSLGDLDIELAPSGYMPGSAQIRISKDRDQIVYTGPFRLTDPLTGQNTPILDCDILVIRAESAPDEDQPDGNKNEVNILSWTRQQLAAGIRPVFYAKPLGEAQELIRLLIKAGLEVSVHASIYRLCRKYEGLKIKRTGIRSLTNRPKNLCAVILPVAKPNTKIFTHMGPTCRAMVSSSGSHHANVHKTGATVLFYLPMHASFQEQLRYVQASKARKIYVTGPAAESFATRLRGLDFCAWPLRPPEQLDLFSSSTRVSIQNEWSP